MHRAEGSRSTSISGRATDSGRSGTYRRAGFTHVAVYQGRIAAADILGREHPPADYTAVPRVTFTDPEVASVGLPSVGARARHRISIGIAKTVDSTRGYIHGPGAEYGVTKVVVDAGSGVVLGASTMGPGAGELVGIFLLAVRERMTADTLRGLIYPYPTFLRGIEPAIHQVTGGQ